MKIHLLILFLFQGFIGIAFAQQSGYTTGNASANLIMPLSITAGYGDLDFGEIFVSSAGSIEKIDPLKGKEFIVQGNPGRDISIVFDKVELNNYQWVSKSGGELSTLVFLPVVTEENSSKIISGDNLILEKSGLIGEKKIFVGGSIKIQPNQPIGNYVGLFIISVSY